MRKYAHTQMSVCIDMLGDVYLYREAGFLNREGNKKFIIGRTSKKNTLKNVLEKFLYDSEEFKMNKMIYVLWIPLIMY